MARKKLPEFIAKKLLYVDLGSTYQGIPIFGDGKKELDSIELLDKKGSFVVKVDQGIKKRGKKGLIAVNVTPDNIKKFVHEFVKKGYTRFLIEDYIPHKQSEERYLSIERTREGLVVRYSLKGGVDIEENLDSVRKRVVTPTDITLTIQIKEYFELQNGI